MTAETTPTPSPSSPDIAGLVERLGQRATLYGGWRDDPETAEVFRQAAQSLAILQGDWEDLEGRIVPGLNRQLTEQFELSSKLASDLLELQSQLSTLREEVVRVLRPFRDAIDWATDEGLSIAITEEGGAIICDDDDFRSAASLLATLKGGANE